MFRIWNLRSVLLSRLAIPVRFVNKQRCSSHATVYWLRYLCRSRWSMNNHYSDVIMDAMTSQVTSLTIVYSAVYRGADQRKHHSSASLAFVRGTHRWPVNSQHKLPVTRKMFPFDDVIMQLLIGRMCYYANKAAHHQLPTCLLDAHSCITYNHIT